MSDSLKRTCTDDDQASMQSQSGSFNRTDTSPELNARLRSVGSRVRKSVMEGYKTPLTSRAFTKAQSTTAIFTSAKDINRDVFGSADPPLSRTGSAKKRSRSTDRGSDTELDTDHDDTTINDTAVPAQTDRVIKPLRKHRGMMETRSLPAGALRFSHRPDNSATTMAPAMEVEEDWSVQSTDDPSRSPFTPVVFD